MPVPTTLARPSIRHNPRQKSEASSHTVALGEMTVHQRVVEAGHLQQITHQGYAFGVGIGQYFARRKIRVSRLVVQRAVHKLPQDRQPCAASSNRLTRSRVSVERLLQQSSLPEVDVT